MIEWSPARIKAFRATLLAWYDAHGRDLPWRQDQEPYHVWVSEIMLQQTQVQTVIPYYQRFMQQFPTVQALSTAPTDQLLKAWEGLGYYSRARNLQRCAQQLMTDYQGQWPTTAEELVKLTGIGPYTAGAIASIAFKEPVPAVDGNAFRVFSRLLEIEADIAQPATRKLFEQVISRIIDPDRPGDFNQAIMDLGSSYMTAKHPDSAHSPVREFNQAYLDGIEDHFPVKTPKAKPVPVAYTAVIVQTPGGFLVTQRPGQGMLANLWTVPLINDDELGLDDDHPLISSVQAYFQAEYQLAIQPQELAVAPVKHTFTHQKWTIKLLVATLTAKPDLQFFPGKVVDSAAYEQLPVPKVQQKIWQRYLSSQDA